MSERLPVQVDQILWFVPNHQATQPCAVTVVKIGRKWAHLSNGAKIDPTTWMYEDQDNDLRNATCYASSEEWDAIIRAIEDWRHLQALMVSFYAPMPGVSAENIRAAAELLGLSFDVRIADLCKRFAESFPAPEGSDYGQTAPPSFQSGNRRP